MEESDLAKILTLYGVFLMGYSAFGYPRISKVRAPWALQPANNTHPPLPALPRCQPSPRHSARHAPLRRARASCPPQAMGMLRTTRVGLIGAVATCALIPCAHTALSSSVAASTVSGLCAQCSLEAACLAERLSGGRPPKCTQGAPKMPPRAGRAVREHGGQGLCTVLGVHGIYRDGQRGTPHFPAGHGESQDNQQTLIW